MSEQSALVPFELLSPPEWKRLAPRLRQAWESFVTGHAKEAPDAVRPAIFSRWRAAAGYGLDPLLSRVPMVATEEELEPLFVEDDFPSAGRRVLEDMSWVVQQNAHALFLTDARGCVLHVAGEPSVVDALRELNARSGGRWDEEAAGPNGMGTALRTNAPWTVFGAEHFCERFHPWVCYGAPVHDPIHGQILGVINLTGWAEKAKANQLPLAISLARSVEYLLLASRGAARHAVLDVARTTAARYPSEGLVACDGAGNVLQTNERAAELLRRSGGGVGELLAHPALERLARDAKRVTEETSVSFRQGALRITAQAVRRAGRWMGTIFLLRQEQAAVSDAVRSGDRGFENFGGDSPAIVEALRLAVRAARCDETVLIDGETGTGKEKIANAIHHASGRANGPFVVVDCTSLPRDLAESELFGYEPGSFTGAQSSGRRGRFELAQSGTLLLDEIGELPLDLQGKLLRVLEERAIVRIGGARPQPIDVRILAATNRDLARAVAEGTFRLDLYHRLAVLEIRLPPLRERGRDVLALAQRFLEEAAARARRLPPRLDPEVEQKLLAYSWPGNIRELRNVTAHLVHWAEGEEVGLTDLPRRLLDPVNVPPREGSLRAIERDLLQRTIDECGGNASAAARKLGINRTTIYRRLRRRGC